MTPRKPGATVAALALAGALATPLAANTAEAMRVVRDPVTGELRGPTAAEATAFKKAEEQLRAAKTGGKAAAAAATQEEIVHPDGTVEMKLGDDSMLYSVATLGADGSVRTHCLPAQQARVLVKASQRKSAVAKVTGKVAP